MLMLSLLIISLPLLPPSPPRHAAAGAAITFAAFRCRCCHFAAAAFFDFAIMLPPPLFAFFRCFFFLRLRCATLISDFLRFAFADFLLLLLSPHVISSADAAIR